MGSTHLSIPSVLQGKARLYRFAINNGRLKGGNDCDVKGGVTASVPVAKENVCRAVGGTRDQAPELTRWA